MEQLTAHAAPLAPEEAADLRRFLVVVPDPRDARGRRYPAPALLCAAAAAVLAGARIAVGEWIADIPQHTLGILGFTADPFTRQRAVPHPATVRRLLERVDGDALDAAIGACLQARHPLAPPQQAEPKRTALRPLAVDDKTVRGSRTAQAAAVHLLAAMTHGGTVLVAATCEHGDAALTLSVPDVVRLGFFGSTMTIANDGDRNAVREPQSITPVMESSQ
ncbi:MULTISPECIES: transposase family protein [Streptomyces]|uniref:transposase family protein n=1 Tax=Streptomyces TaxID=1883 RepID=UPI001331933A|nr:MULTISPECIES: transposase family protein [Streptomyces]